MARYKAWRSNTDKSVHLVCREGTDAFEALPAAIRHLGPWTGSKEGEVAKLRLAYRMLIEEQGFALVYAHVNKLQLEAPGKADIDQHPLPHVRRHRPRRSPRRPQEED